ncbi:MAG TPA: hypothetical protein VNT60_09865 [Deinococcales bacterium]|nr:hypothetical protein [Deinococcales bacterium]
MSERDDATNNIQEAAERFQRDMQLEDELVPRELRQPEGGLVNHQGESRSTEGIEPGSSGYLGAVDTEVTPTATPVPGRGGDPESDIDPADETPGGG